MQPRKARPDLGTLAEAVGGGDKRIALSFFGGELFLVGAACFDASFHARLDLATTSRFDP